jgi:hypothetical protein
MPTPLGPRRRRADRYLAATRHPLVSLLFVLPLLAVYHLGAGVYGTSLLAPWVIRRFLDALGATGALLAPALVVVVLAAQWIGRRRQRVRVRPALLAGMAAESAACALPVLALSWLTRQGLAAAGGAPDALPLGQQLIRALGAGIYEEFLFRLVLISLALLVFSDVFELRKEAVTAAAVLVSAALFSAAHFPFAGLGGQVPFRWGDFAFFAGAGAFWGVLYVLRGFAIAAGAHACWDVLVAVTAA